MKKTSSSLPYICSILTILIKFKVLKYQNKTHENSERNHSV